MTHSHPIAMPAPPSPVEEHLGRPGLMVCVEIHSSDRGYGLPDRPWQRTETVAVLSNALSHLPSWTIHVRPSTAVALVACTGGEDARSMAEAIAVDLPHEWAIGYLVDRFGACEALRWSGLQAERESTGALWRARFPTRTMHEASTPALQKELGRAWTEAEAWVRYGTLARSGLDPVAIDVHATDSITILLPSVETLVAA